MIPRLVFTCIVFCLSLSRAWGDVADQSGADANMVARNAFIPLHSTKSPQHTNASLFSGTSKGSMFAPPVRQPRSTATRRRPQFGDHHAQIQRILDLIAQAEAGPMGYDAVQYSARIKPPKPPTQMTLAEIERWTRSTPRQQHAIGRYQFIPATLRRLTRHQNLTPDTRFSPEVQDALAHQLLKEAGLNGFTKGKIGRRDFMLNLAKIWAGLPLASGRSYYSGVANNKATISWDRFLSEMTRIFPNRA